MQVLDISERSYDGGNALAVTLSIPLDTTQSNSEYFLLTDVKKGMVSASPIISDNGKTVYFPTVEPDTEYQLTVHKGLTGVQGKPLDLSEEATITTRGIKANYRFKSKGAFLSLSQHKGLPIEVINTPELNVDFFKVDDDKVAQFVGGNSYFQEKTYRYETTAHLKHTSLIYSARYTFDAPKNKRREFNIPVRSIDALSTPGIYVAVMSLPGDFQRRVRMSYFTVTDIGMHARFYPEGAEILLSSLATQSPLANVSLEMLDKKGEILYQTQSSPDGFATINGDMTKGRFLIARKDSSFSIIETKTVALDLSDFELAMRPFAPQELFLYSPRNLYRPGEKITINGLLRNFDGQMVASPALEAILRRPDGSNAQYFTLQSEQAGFYQINITIPEDAATGIWTLDVSNVAEAPVSYQFKVEEFLPERLKLTFNKNEKSPVVVNTRPFNVSILGEYLYGAPASQNRFEPRLTFRAKRNPFEDLKDFQFGQDNEKKLRGEIELEDVHLDDSGQAIIEIDSYWKTLKSPIEARLIGSLFESGGRPVTRIHNITLVPDNQLLGIKPLFEGDPDENTRINFEIVSVDTSGKLTNLDDIDVLLVREDRRYFWEYSDHEGWHYEWTDKEYVVGSSVISTNTEDAIKLEFPVEYGRYRIEVKHMDSEAFSSLRFFAGTDWYNNWQENRAGTNAARPDMVSLAWNQENYEPGDIAQLTIVPPQEGEAIVLVEADRLLWSKRITVPQDGTTLEIPVNENWKRHDIHVSVVHLQHGKKSQNITPSRAIGLIHLPLNRESQRLDVAITVDKKIYPNQNYSAKVSVSGQQKQAYVTLAMVDVGVLSLTNFDTPDPHNYFFEPRRFQVDARDIYQKLIELNDSPFAKQRFGGDASLSRGGENARSEVQIVSLFSGLVEVDENGNADISFEIPDFNGKVRLMAVAFTEEQFGSAEQEMTIAAPVVTQLSLPRFIATDDEFTLALDFHNLMDASQELKVQLKATEPLTLQQSVTLELQPDEKTTLRYPVKVGSIIQDSAISLKVDGIKDYELERQWSLAVRSPYPAIINKKATVLQKNQVFEFSNENIQELIPKTFEAILTVGNSVNLNIQSHMENLLRYPYGCLEQTTSSTYPWLYAAAESRLTSGFSSEVANKKLDAIEKGLNRIRDKATRNGSFGLWRNTDNEEHWLTAYVGDFLSDARKQGVAIDTQLYNNTMSRLQDYVNNKNGDFYNRWSEAGEHYDFAYRTYAAYVLSRHQKAPLSSLRTLMKKADKAQSPLPLVHLGLALINQGDSKAGNDLISRSKETKRASGYLGDYGSELRDKALIIRLLLEYSIEVGFANQMAYDLAEAVRSKRYLSTQELNALFLAGVALENQESSLWKVEFEMDGLVSSLQQNGTYTDRFDAELLGTGMNISNTVNDAIYVDLTYQGVPRERPEPVFNGLKIYKDYYDLNGNRITADTLKVGDLALVSLLVMAESKHPDLLVIDLLPAGLEIENQNLEHSIKLDEFKLDKFSVGDWVRGTKIVHEEFRDDRYVAAIDLAHHNAAKVFYLVRAVTPGKYRVPAPLVEDMYRPEFNATGAAIEWMSVVEH